MAFKGLFVGVDRYESPRLNWLNCAVRDATAMHALFKDTLGGETSLIVDEDATLLNIQNAFEKLVNSDPDDFVVVYFSGHGTETHQLVTYDAKPWDYEKTAIPLDLLTKWFSLITAKKVLCILDCCFSGGMGAKAFQVEDHSRDTSSEEGLLEQLSGEGRLIFTASGPKEKSWENSRIGHGWMTNFLLEALQGAEEVRKDGKVSVYSLLEYVTGRVIDATSKTGKKQNPSIRGSIDGEFKLPIFTPGETYIKAFPERAPKEVTSDLNSLATYGFPQELIEVWSGVIPSLNQLQLDAVNEFGVLKGEPLVVSAPTSSGKTMIGELAALQAALQRKRTIFLFPLKAIVNDKQRYFMKTYGDFGIRTIRVTGDSTSDETKPLMRGQYDICLLTYEKFSAIVLANPFILEQVNTIVIDEVQMIADKSRGSNLEFLLTLIKARKKEGIDPQVICLSAVIGDTNGLERWLGARLLKRIERPVPLDEGLINGNGDFRFIDSSNGEEKVLNQIVVPNYGGSNSSQVIIKPLVKKLVDEGKQVLIFRDKKGDTTGCANYLVPILRLPPAEDAINRLPNGDNSVVATKLKAALQGGIAFHNADLNAEQRLIVEEEYRKPDSKIRVIVATTTLAMGINTPAEAVVVAGLEHPDGPYSIAEYKNIIGRAGRLGAASKGISYLVSMTNSDEHLNWNKYVKGQAEDLKSMFFSRDTDPRLLILKVLVAAKKTAGEGLPKEEVVSFLEESFGSFQEKLNNPNWSWDRDALVRSLEELASHDLIDVDQDGKYTLTPLGRLCGESGVEVESVIRLVEAFDGTDLATINDPTLLVAAQLTVELDKLSFVMHRTSRSEPQTWLSEVRRQSIAPNVFSGLNRRVSDSRQPGLRAKKAASTLLWITGKPLEEIEQTLTQTWGRFDGASGAIRTINERVCDVLPTVAKVAELLNHDLNFGDRIPKLLIRLELGIPAILVDLATITASRLSRPDYSRLLENNLASIEQVENATDEVILACVDGNNEKLQLIKAAVVQFKEEQSQPSEPVLPAYEG